MLRLRVILIAALLAAGLFFPIAGAVVAATDPAAGTAVSAVRPGSEMDKFMSEVDREVAKYMPHLNVRGIIDAFLQGKPLQGVREGLTTLFQALFWEIRASYKFLVQLIVLGMVAAVLEHLQRAMDRGSTGQVAHAVIYLVLISMAVTSFSLALNSGREAVEKMVDFMQALLPLLVTLLAAAGNVTTAAIVHPLTAGIFLLVGSLIKNVVFPLLFLSVIVGVIGNFNEQFSLSRLASFLRTLGMYAFGLTFTLLVGYISFQGLGGGFIEGIVIRTAKFSSGVFIPVVGKMFADALDAVAGSALLVKNAVGLLGVIVLFGIVLVPVLKILALFFTYRLAAALMQPVCDGRLVKCLDQMGDALHLVMASLLAVSMLFFLTTAVVVAAGNVAAMLR